MSRLTREGTAEPVSRKTKFLGLNEDSEILGIFFPFSANDEQDWQPHPVDPYSSYM